MKKTYRTPIAKKVDYAFQEQIAAASVPVEHHTDWHHTGIVCTWGATQNNCSVIYNVPTKARGLNDCMSPGDIPGIG